MTLRELLEAFTPFATPASPEQWSCGVDAGDLKCAVAELGVLEASLESAYGELQILREQANGGTVVNRDLAAIRVCLTWIAYSMLKKAQMDSECWNAFEKQLRDALSVEERQ